MMITLPSLRYTMLLGLFCTAFSPVVFGENADSVEQNQVKSKLKQIMSSKKIIAIAAGVISVVAGGGVGWFLYNKYVLRKQKNVMDRIHNLVKSDQSVGWYRMVTYDKNDQMDVLGESSHKAPSEIPFRLIRMRSQAGIRLQMYLYPKKENDTKSNHKFATDGLDYCVLKILLSRGSFEVIENYASDLGK